MQVLDKDVLSQLVGGKVPAAPGDGSDGGGNGGNGGVGGGSGGIGSGGDGFQLSGHAYDIAAVGIEGGREAVVRISGAIPVFDNPPPSASLSHDPAAWEGSLLGIYVEPTISGVHQVADDILLSAVWGRSSATATHVITKALEGAGIIKYAPGPVKIAGMAIGTAATIGSYMLMERDHPKEKGSIGWIDRNGVRHQAPVMAPDHDNITSFTGPAGGAVMQMVA